MPGNFGLCGLGLVVLLMIDYETEYKEGEPRYHARIDCVWDKLEQKLIKFEDMVTGEECSFALPEKILD